MTRVPSICARRWPATSWALALSILLPPHPLAPAEIVVEGGCTLVDAVTAANTDAAAGACPAGSGDDEIVLTADVVLTESVDGVNGLPELTSGITLRGNGFEISRDPAAAEFRILAVPDSGFSGLTAIENVTLSGGALTAEDGGAIWFGSRSTEMVLTNVTLSGNQARIGGGLRIAAGGHGFYRQVKVVDSRITGNQAQTGGGISKAYGGYLDLISSTISGNTASGSGGGLSTSGGWYPFGQPGYSYVTDSTISANSAYYGGGITAFGGLRLTNSTVSGNYAVTAGGGLVTYTGNYEPNSITHSTISGNSTGSGLGGGLYNTTSGFVADELRVTSSIIAGNADTNCVLDNFDIDGSGTNFDDDGTCGQEWEQMTGLDPDLGDNGGPTETHALLAGSSALNAGGACSLATDQRGAPRTDGACDSGSYERNGGFLDAEGSCPGPTTVSVVGASAGVRMQIFQGTGSGSSEVPSGVCAGSGLDITEPHIAGVLQTDATGAGSVVLNLDAQDCDQFLQGVAELDCATTNVVEFLGCNELALSHTGSGSDPVPSPAGSPECPVGTFLSGEAIGLTATPDPSWVVGGWTGTDDDASTSEMNSVTMPGSDHAVEVSYDLVCHKLTVTRSGQGSKPQASPSTMGCSPGRYLPGEVIQLSGADPSDGWVIGGWSGTDDDGSTDPTNTVTMPSGNHTATVRYEDVCFELLLSHTGAGGDPVPSPSGSIDCPSETYSEGEIVDLSAAPFSGWAVAGWSGTDDDGSTAAINTVTMPAGIHSAGVDYAATCGSLALEHTGMGADPTATALPDGTDWQQAAVAGSFEDTWGLRTVDFDGDLDQDIVAASFFQGVAWWENVAGDGTSWIKHVVANPVNGAASIFPADIDGDLDLDFVGPAFWDEAILWWENTDGTGTAWSEHVVAGNLRNTRSAHAADLDGDGDLDVLGTADQDDVVRWWENLAGDGSSWLEHTLTDSLNQAGWVFAADIDGDTDPDVVANGGIGNIVWFENVNGDGSLWTEHPMAVPSGSRSAPVDLDGDGDLDIVSASGIVAYWLENAAGDGSAWKLHLLEGTVSSALGAVAGDVDGDGDPDVVAVDFNTAIVWWENLAGDASTWLPRELARFADVRPVALADFDGDGSLDVVGGGDSLAWWQNRYGGSCPAGDFHPGDRLALSALPDPGWEVAGWSGTENDASTESMNVAAMPIGDHVASVDYVESAPASPTLSMSGACPGQIDVSVADAVPDRNVVLYAGSSGGATVIAGGTCAGTELDLGPARRWKTLSADGSGEASFSFTASAGWCSRSAQAVDGRCVTSNVEDVP